MISYLFAFACIIVAATLAYMFGFDLGRMLLDLVGVS